MRFLDPVRDYQIAGVSARRRDSAEGGVATVEAPLVLEMAAAERIAERVLARARMGAEHLTLALGFADLALEPGDRVVLSDEPDRVFEIARIEDAETRRIEARRVSAAPERALHLAEGGAPASPMFAATPAVSILDLPPLPGAESDERPLAATFAAPWSGEHEVFAGAPLSVRARVARPAIMGELLWALWPGPVDRWDEGNRLRIKLYGGVLSSVDKAALLGGANAFAIESADGEWEIVQARAAVLVAPNEYELSGFLRGLQDSAHAMRAPHPVGARIVKLDARLARLDIGAHEWGQVAAFSVPPSGAAAESPRAAALSLQLHHAAARMWAPAHLRARRLPSGDIRITWTRQARIGGDYWGAGEPPLGAPSERYRLEILDGETLKREIASETASYDYSVSDQTADFGGPPSALHVRAAQLNAAGEPGLKTDLTMPL